MKRTLCEKCTLDQKYSINNTAEVSAFMTATNLISKTKRTRREIRRHASISQKAKSNTDTAKHAKEKQ